MTYEWQAGCRMSDMQLLANYAALHVYMSSLLIF